MRQAAALAMLCALTLAPSRGAADAAPPGVRSVDYKLVISNLDDYPTHVFIVYPTRALQASPITCAARSRAIDGATVVSAGARVRALPSSPIALSNASAAS
jgi:hypothetical protein